MDHIMKFIDCVRQYNAAVEVCIIVPIYALMERTGFADFVNRRGYNVYALDAMLKDPRINHSTHPSNTITAYPGKTAPNDVKTSVPFRNPVSGREQTVAPSTVMVTTGSKEEYDKFLIPAPTVDDLKAMTDVGGVNKLRKRLALTEDRATMMTQRHAEAQRTCARLEQTVQQQTQHEIALQATIDTLTRQLQDSTSQTQHLQQYCRQLQQQQQQRVEPPQPRVQQQRQRRENDFSATPSPRYHGNRVSTHRCG